MNFSSLAASSDLSGIPLITFSEREAYSKTESGCENTYKAYKFFAEPLYCCYCITQRNTAVKSCLRLLSASMVFIQGLICNIFS